MNNLEHNIKEAFTVKDSNTKLLDKEAMWNRLEGAMHQKKGVASLWRVAAIFLLFLLSASVFAAIHNRIKHKNELEKITIENARLLNTIDSLKAFPVETKTEIQLVEKEKVVYLDRYISTSATTDIHRWEQKYVQLMDSTKLVLANSEKQYLEEMEKLKNDLATVQNELAMKSYVSNEQKVKQGSPFELKSDRVEFGVPKSPTVKNHEFRVQILQKGFENKNDLNNTLFNK